MLWIRNALPFFFIIFGAVETLTNLVYLLQPNGLALARKQHQEMPKFATPTQMHHKVLCMFLFGILFLVSGLYAFVSPPHPSLLFCLISGFFMVYVFIEAMIYRYWKLFGAVIIAAIIFTAALYA